MEEIMSKREDLLGKRFGRLIVVEFYGTDNGCHALWLCKCDCGNTTIARGYDLKGGKIISCGCFWKERLVECNTTHNLSKTHRKLYGEYHNMIKRCYDDNCKNYSDYGARGIKVCDEWRNDIRSFYNDVSVLEHFEEDGYSLDRINNDGDYTPNNVKWSTIKEQNLNKRNTLKVEYNGETRTLKEWSEIFGIPYNVFYQRVRRTEGDLEKAAAINPKRSYRKYAVENKNYSAV